MARTGPTMSDPAVLSAIVIALGSLAVAIVTQRQNHKGVAATTALTARVVDREDFDTVMTRMEKDLERSDKRITQLEARLEAEVVAREQAEARAIRAEQRADAAEKRVTRLERRVSQLERELLDHDIPVPPMSADNR